MLVKLRIRRMRCLVAECARQTFREQVPGLIERYQRRTVRLGEQVRAVVRELAGRASTRLLPAIGIALGRDTAVRVLLGIPLPDQAVPRVLGIDDFALSSPKAPRSPPPGNEVWICRAVARGCSGQYSGNSGRIETARSASSWPMPPIAGMR